MHVNEHAVATLNRLLRRFSRLVSTSISDGHERVGTTCKYILTQKGPCCDTFGCGQHGLEAAALSA
jgi:hypothetical protein